MYSLMRSVKALLTVFHWLIIAVAHLSRRASILFLMSRDAVRSLWERWMLSLLNLAQVAGTELLEGIKTTMKLISDQQYLRFNLTGT